MDKIKDVLVRLKQNAATSRAWVNGWLTPRIKSALSKANAFLQTPFGATTGGGVVLLIVARLLG